MLFNAYIYIYIYVCVLFVSYQAIIFANDGLNQENIATACPVSREFLKLVEVCCFSKTR